MHEGVLIISQKNHEIMFYNKPAQQLLSSCMIDQQTNVGHRRQANSKERQDGYEEAAQDNFSNLSYEQVIIRARFCPVKVSDRNLAENYKTLLNQSKTKPVSLEQIILTQ